MTARRRLPHRRGAVAFDIEHDGHRYRMHVGYFLDGAVAPASLIGEVVDELHATERQQDRSAS